MNQPMNPWRLWRINWRGLGGNGAGRGRGRAMLADGLVEAGGGVDRFADDSPGSNSSNSSVTPAYGGTTSGPTQGTPTQSSTTPGSSTPGSATPGTGTTPEGNPNPSQVGTGTSTGSNDDGSELGAATMGGTGTSANRYQKADVTRDGQNYYFMANGWGPGFVSQNVSWNGTSFNVTMQGGPGPQYQPASYPTMFCGAYSDSRSKECGLPAALDSMTALETGWRTASERLELAYQALRQVNSELDAALSDE